MMMPDILTIVSILIVVILISLALGIVTYG